MYDRYLSDFIQNDLPKKMVFLGGPRQVGKTTLAKTFLADDSTGYMNYDVPEHRENILTKELPLSKLWIFDEIHKYHSWRNYLKGIYDVKSKDQLILVTGSARLDYYRFGGDSLQGRYYFWRLHPLSVAELNISTQNEFNDLMTLGGFPEPFFGSSEIDAKRWSREYRNRLIQEDILSLENIKNVGSVELLILRLPNLVGSPLSINALREDLQVNHKTVSNWLSTLERMYAIFRLSPFGSPLIKAVKKEQKHYHYDWTLIKNSSLRFENMIASHLLKWVHFKQDSEGLDFELRYFRDIEKREVDFVITEDNEPKICIECKYSDDKIQSALKYFKRKFPNCKAYQLVFEGRKEYQSPEGIIVMPALKYLKGLI